MTKYGDLWEYTEKQTQLCKQLLKKFDAVSVREANGVELCNKYFDVEALQVLDPTMLLTEKEYCKLFQIAQTPKSKGTLLNYVLDRNENIDMLIAKIALEKGLIPYAVNNPFEYDETKPVAERIKPSIETWLRGFYDAEFVVTDSFHACVFSILFKKQFIVVGNQKRGLARLESLLRMFQLEDRLVKSKENILKLSPIDYTIVYDIYEQQRQRSVDFLFELLN